MNNRIEETDKKAIKLEAERAEAKLGNLREHAARLSSQAEEAVLTFERNPSPETLTARDVLAQKAKNAAAEASAFADSIADILAEATRVINQERLAELQGRLDWNAATKGTLSRIQCIYKDFQSELEKELRVLATQADDFNAASSEADAIVHRLGINVPSYGEQTITKLHEQLQEAIESVAGRRDPGDDNRQRYGELSMREANGNRLIVEAGIGFTMTGTPSSMLWGNK